MKRKVISAVILSALLSSRLGFAGPGLLFNINATGDPGSVNITLCLNAESEVSCQKYTVSALDLSILTTPIHVYHTAGIRIDSPLYLLDTAASNCKPLNNGYCQFLNVSNTTPANVKIKGPDYIVVGAGTAGAVVTKRLSDGNQNYVVAIHNGPNLNQDPLINLSKNAIFTVLSGLIGPPLYALSQTVPQIFADDRIINWIYALPLGGASSVNAGAWCRETVDNNNEWESIAGPEWSNTSIQNTYIALENYTGTTENPAARGFNGPLPIRQETNPGNVSFVFTQAIVDGTGVPLIDDYNNPLAPIGASPRMQYTQFGIDGALRASSSIIFLNSSVMDTSGKGVNGRLLRVLFNATADNVIWQGNKAVGVNYYQNGIRQNIYAKKGIVLSAGVKSSTILMRSGVGPAALLQSLNIPVVYDNPNVGSALADQPHVVLIYTSDPDDTTSSFAINIASKIISALAQTSIGQQIIANIGANLNVKNGIFSQIAWLPDPGGDPTVRALRFASINPIPGITVVLFDLVQPKSRGSIAINSTDPFVEPTFNLGILSNPDDLSLYITGFQSYIQNINAQLPSGYQLVYPDPGIIPVTPALTEFILDGVGTNMHFQGHCRMAPLNQGGVVDSTGHVYGVQNLIVADDSVVPVTMDGSPMATAYLVAEKISSLILGP